MSLLLIILLKLVAAKAALMNADYRADLPKLAALRTEMVALRDDPELGYLADYWSGYASHRIAMNGVGAGMSPADIRMHLERAVADYESSARRKPDFADAYAAASSVHGWLAYPSFYPDDKDAAMVHYKTASTLLKKAEELEPSNPRVMWIRAAFFLYSPPERGGSIDKAMEIYRRQIDAAASLAPDSPLPDWGKPEALMSLAFAESMKKEPDVDAAIANARAALKLAPQWHYVRDVLLPKLEAKRVKEK